MLFRRKKPMEDAVADLIKAELAGIAAEIERDRREYRRRSEARERTLAALEGAEAEARKTHSERVALKKCFWEAYYGEDGVALSKIERELRLSKRAVRKADKALKKARAGFERADFDEAAERSALRAKADAVEDGAERQIGALVQTTEDLLVGIRDDIEEACRDLRNQCEGAAPSAVEMQDDDSQETVELHQGTVDAPRTAQGCGGRVPNAPDGVGCSEVERIERASPVSQKKGEA